jgi:hypothetical protein
MSLRPQDVFVLLSLIARAGRASTQAETAKALGMSVSTLHGCIERACEAGLARREERAPAEPIREALREFLVHGARYAFAAKLGASVRGMPTAHAAPPLREVLSADDDPPPVWPDPHGSVRGPSVRPLHRSVPAAARLDPRLYELLALVDALRIGRARERDLAAEMLSQRLR